MAYLLDGETAFVAAARAAGLRGRRRARAPRPPGRRLVRALDGPRRADRRDARRSPTGRGRAASRLAPDDPVPHHRRGVARAGLVAIVEGLPAGLELDRETIQHDLWRRQQGYGRIPRQQIETDQLEVLAGLRQGRTLGTPLALVVPNRDHKNWTWGMSPWQPEGEPAGKGTKPVTLPRPGHADLSGVLKYEHDDVRNALERASARHTAVFVAAGGVAKALLATIGIAVEGRVTEFGGETELEKMHAAVDAARKDRDTLGGTVEVRATGCPPGLGTYAVKEQRLDGRLAQALMAIQAVKAVEIGEGEELARKRGSEAHDEIYRDERGFHRRRTTRAGSRAG